VAAPSSDAPQFSHWRSGRYSLDTVGSVTTNVTQGGAFVLVWHQSSGASLRLVISSSFCEEADEGLGTFGGSDRSDLTGGERAFCGAGQLGDERGIQEQNVEEEWGMIFVRNK
jgi:hypothetical protein